MTPLLVCVYPILCGVGTGILALLVQVGQDGDVGNYGDYDDDCDCSVMSMVLPFLVHVGQHGDGDDDYSVMMMAMKIVTTSR